MAAAGKAWWSYEGTLQGGSAIGQEKRCGVTPHLARNDVICADEMTSFELTKRHSRVPE